MEAPAENPPQQESNEEQQQQQQQQQQQPIETNENAQPVEEQQQQQALDETSQSVDAPSDSMIANDSEQQTLPSADQAVTEEDTAHKQDEATPITKSESEAQPESQDSTSKEEADTATPMDEDISRKPEDNASSNEQQNEMDHSMPDAEPLQQQQASQSPSSSSTSPATSTSPSQSQATTSSATAPQPPPPSFISEPASWQIPPSALQANNTSSPGLRAASPAISAASNVYNNTRMDVTPEPATNKAQAKRERLEQRIAKSQYDSNAWLALINEIQQTGDLEATRDVYERFLEVFPTASRQWLAYLELELKYSNFAEVEALFTRCLKTVLSVDLWKFYLGYIRRINQGDSGTTMTPEARAIIEKAYEYVLNNVGIDKEAGSIWADYIYFLKSAEATNTWEEQRKMDSMRRAYQKAVAIPLNNVEHLWKEYDQWENNLNRLTAKKFLGEKSAAYMTARTALREMKALTDGINRNVVPRPPQWTDKEISQLDLWKQYIQWEKNNPLQLEDESLVVDRVAYAYQQAFLVLRFYPEIWYDFAMYYHEMEKPEKALSVLKQGIEVLPTSLLINFAYAEICETRRQSDDARQAFDTLLEYLDKEVEKLQTACQEEVDKIQADADEEKANMNLSDDIDGEMREQLRTREKQIKKEQDEVKNRTNEQVTKLAKACSLVWINYMRFARRTEGIKAARALFSRARKAANRTYHVFVASALMEYHNSKDATVAGKIFGLGLKQFADDPDYVCVYLDYLIQMNDDNNTRALFEKALATLPPSKSEVIWSKFLDYENKYGDLQGMQNVEKRRREALPGITNTQSFLERHSYLDVHSIEELDLGAEVRQHKIPESKQAAVAAASAAAVAAAPATAGSVNATPDRGRQKDGKRPLLEAVNPERYPRPDFSQWQSFKPSESRRAPATMPTSTPGRPSPVVDMAPVQVSAPPPPMQPPTSAPMAGGMPPPPQQQPPPMGPPAWSQPPTQPTMTAPSQPMPTPTAGLPDPVAYFVSNLPPPQTFNGPKIQAGELVDLLRNVIIPLPQQAMAPGRGPPPKPMGGGQHMPPRDMPPQRGGFGGRGRGGGGGYKGRGGGPGRGGKPNQKRRNRDDYEDDYGSHKGMGPNRPPPYDVFRSRQAKRHRDDPGY